MRPLLRRSILLAAGVGLGLGAGCFDGLASIGSVCFQNDECGPNQVCTNAVCGMCGDREIQAGELCFASSSEEGVIGWVADVELLGFYADGRPVIAAVINRECMPAGNGPCWWLATFEIDEDGDFELSYHYENMAGTIPQIAVGNFDGNGAPDLAFAVIPNEGQMDEGFPEFGVLYDFPAVANSLSVGEPFMVQSLQAADLDEDGLDDILVTGLASSAIRIYPALASGGFGTERTLVSDLAPRLAPPADLDGDGDLDLAVASESDATVGVHFNLGGLGFDKPPRASVDGNLRPSAVDTADFDGDGFGDLVVFAPPPVIQAQPRIVDTEIPGRVYVFSGSASGELSLLAELDGGEDPIFGFVEDVNYDGLIDIVVADHGEDQLPVHLNRGGSFPDAVAIDVAPGPRTLLYQDFNQDDRPDIIVGNGNGVVAVVPANN